MKLVDVHCHLTHDYYSDKLEQCLKNAKDNNVKIIVCSGVNPKSNREVLELCKKYPQIKASLGLYPIDLLGLEADDIGFGRKKDKFDIDEELKFIEQNLDKVISIGEIGMDFHWAKKEDTLKQQQDNFRKIIQFAKRVNKPIVIHSRKAELECIDLLENELPNNEIPVINHCFGGKKKYIKRAADLGYNFSVPAVIKKLQHFQTLVEIVPMNQLLTETDSPYLSPRPEGYNEPANIIESVKMIAKIKNLTLEETHKQLWENFCRIFNYKEK